MQSVEIVGAGPAGLYTAILLRRHFPDVQVRVTEQNPQGATFGFGVVFSDQALDFLKADDPDTHQLATPHMQRWQNMTLNHPRGQITLDGVGFASIGRLELIEILRKRAEALGVELQFGTRVERVDSADLTIAADGLNSVVRANDRDGFGESLSYLGNHFVWFGAERPFDTLTQTFINTDAGPMNAHHYRYSADKSTFIVECSPDTFNKAGFARMSEDESRMACQQYFANTLNGADLITNHSQWRQFPKLWCDHWVSGRQVLVGDAAHTAHFSVGSGTRLAMEDSIALVQALIKHADIDVALQRYQQERQGIAKKIVDAANVSAEWYESFGDKMSLAPMDFAFDYITRSGRVDMDRLRKMSPQFCADYEAYKSAAITDPVPNSTSSAQEINFDPDEHTNCSDILWQQLHKIPEKLAVIGPAGNLTYKQLISEAARWGNAFIAAGLNRGDRVAFFLDDTPCYPAAFFGATRAGFVPVLLNTQTNQDTLNYFLKDSDATIALCEATLTDQFSSTVLAGTNIKTVVVANGTLSSKPFIGAEEFLKSQSTSLPCADTSAYDMALWMYSSGSTGRPKGIVHLHHDMAYTQASYADNILKLDPDDICFSVPKIYFAYGFGNSITFPFSVGATSVLMPDSPRPEAVLDTIETFKPTVLFGLPTLYTALCRVENVDSKDLSSLTQSISAAETLSQDIYDAWKSLTGHGPTEGLGSTEMLHIYLSNLPNDHRIGAAGARVPGYEVKLETPDGKPVAEGEEGVMFVRGHSSAPCYWNKPDKTKETMRDDWLYTGDRFIQREGYYYFMGRADDLIKVSGQWVWPLEVERCLNDHPDVHECAVLAHELPDKRLTLRAIVSLRDECKDEQAQSTVLQNHIKNTLQPFKYPRIVEFVAELPKTGTGKIDRQALRSPANASV